MYTEIKEAVNYLARCLFHHVPRRKIGLWSEELANIWLRNFIRGWDPNDPTKGESARLIYVRRGTTLDQNIRFVASHLAIDIMDLLRFLPDAIVIKINPGFVGCRTNIFTEFTVIWSGSVDEDSNYVPTPEFVTYWNAANDLYAQHDMERRRTVHDHIPLYITENNDRRENDIVTTLKPPKIFQFKGYQDQHFTVVDFALTRFGSLKQRPDYDLMRRIQCRDACPTAGSLNSGSTSSSSEPFVPPQFADVGAIGDHVIPSMPVLLNPTSGPVMFAPALFEFRHSLPVDPRTASMYQAFDKLNFSAASFSSAPALQNLAVSSQKVKPKGAAEEH